MDKYTEVSRWAGDDDEDEVASDPFWQFELVKKAAWQVMAQPEGFGKPIFRNDLRGRSYSVKIADDGLSVTVEEIV